VFKRVWSSVAIAALTTIPGVAQAVAGSPTTIVATQGAAIELVQILRRAPIDGLASGPQLAGMIEQAIGAARTGDPRAVADAERMMSAAWVVYVQTLRAPTPGMIYGDPSIPGSAPQAALILRDAARAPSLAAYLSATSAVNPTYAALRQAAFVEAEANGVPSPRLLANLDRARALPAAGRFVLVNAAAQRLDMVEDGRVVDSMKVIVGKLKYPTPMIASRINYATLNPYWHVPEHLVREVIAANVVKKGEAYLKMQGYQVVSEYADDAEILSPSSVDWKAVAGGTQIVKIRQLPGAANSLGTVKFSFANGEGIYLHDTPEKELFAKDQRTLSNGCVRLEDAARLGRWLAGGELRTTSAVPEQHVRLERGVPIYITYLTATASNGALSFVDDVYGRDAPPIAKTAALR
jgi:L,D-transpeptidase YcbB